MLDRNDHKNALKIVSRMLQSEDVERVWNIYHAAKSQQNPAPEIAKKLSELSTNGYTIEKDREALSFARGFIEYELKALGKTWKLPFSDKNAPLQHQDRIEKRQQLDHLAGTLREMLPNEERIDNEEITGDAKNLLRALGKYTTQRVALWTDFKEAIKDVANDLKDVHEKISEQAKPIKYGVYGASMAALLSSGVLMYEGFQAKNADTRMEIQETATTNLSASAVYSDDMMMGMGNVDGTSTFTPEIDEKNYDADFTACHDNLKGTFPTIVTKLEQNDVKIPEWPHCLKVNALSYNTQQLLLKSDAILKGPYNYVMNTFVDEPLETTADTSLFENSHFIKGAEAVSKPLQDGIYYVNRIENTLHIPLGITFLLYGFANVFRMQRKTPEEWQEFRDGWVNFGHRAAKARPLNYLFPVMAVSNYLATHGYDSTGSMVDSNLLLLTVAGALTGYAAHKVAAKIESNKPHVMTVTQEAEELLKNFSASAQPLSVQNQIDREKTKSKRIKNRLLGAGGLSTYCSIVAADLNGNINAMDPGIMQDFAIGAAQTAGAIPVATTIIGAFLPYNFLIEDPAQHSLFIGGGWGIGTGAGLSILATMVAAKYGPKLAQKYYKEFTAATLAASLSITPTNAVNAENTIPQVDNAVIMLREKEFKKQKLELLPTPI